MKIHIFLFFCLLLASCVNDNKRNEINKFLYLSQDGTLHSNKNCKNISMLKYKGITINGIKFIDTTGITDKMFTAFCPKCFSDQQYEHVREIIRRNNEQNIIIDSTYTIFDSKSKYTDYYQVIINGKFVNVPKSDIDKQGWDAYGKNHPGAELRLKDKNGRNFAIVFDGVERSMSEYGTRPFIFRVNHKQTATTPPSPYTDNYQVFYKGKKYNVPKNTLDKQGWAAYEKSHPGAKLRMRDKNNEDYAVPFYDINLMQQEGGLRPYMIRSYTKRT